MVNAFATDMNATCSYKHGYKMNAAAAAAAAKPAASVESSEVGKVFGCRRHASCCQ